MTCHRFHLESQPSEEEAEKLLAEIFGEPLDDVMPLGNEPLDKVLASRSHVRILRVLILFGDDINLTGRDIARRACISRARAQDVLRDLVATGVVTPHRAATWTIYEMNSSSTTTPLVRSLFESERQLTSA